MKFAVKIVLFLFIGFLATPTIVSVIKKNCDVSNIYNMSEEELAHKEVKAEFKFDANFVFVNLSGFTTSLILSKNNLSHDNIAATIFIPPPDEV